MRKRTKAERWLNAFYVGLVAFNVIRFAFTGDWMALIVAMVIAAMAVLIWVMQTDRIRREHDLYQQEMARLYREYYDRGLND